MRIILLAVSLLAMPVSAQPMAHMPGMAAPATQADAAYDAAMEKMMAGMKTTATGNPDADFVAGMIPHHQGAIDMARTELKYGKDPILRHLAAGIVTAQTKEIAFMRAWQAKHAAK